LHNSSNLQAHTSNSNWSIHLLFIKSAAMTDHLTTNK
jgi:hypothetical protein